jgi:hypothetical protein
MVVNNTLYYRLDTDCNVKDTSLRYGKQQALIRGIEADYDANSAYFHRGTIVDYNRGNEKRVKKCVFYFDQKQLNHDL